jgi:hypothetical protein
VRKSKLEFSQLAKVWHPEFGPFGNDLSNKVAVFFSLIILKPLFFIGCVHKLRYE